MRELGATPLAISAISSTSVTTLALARIIGGYVADVYGRKEVVWKATMIAAFQYIVYALAPSWEMLLLGSLLGSLALFYQPALRSLLADLTRFESRGRTYALVNFSASLLSAVSPSVAAWLISTHGLVGPMRAIYAASFIAGIVAGIIRWRFIEETLGVRDKVSFLDSYREALRFVKNRLMSLLTIELLIAASRSLAILIPYYSVYYLGVSEANWGYAWTIGLVAGLIVSIPSGYLVDRVGRGASLVLSLILQGAGVLPLLLALPNSWGAFCAVLLSTLFSSIGNSMYFVAMPTMRADLVPQEKRGRVESLVELIADFTRAPLSIVAGAVYEIDPKMPLLASLAVVSVASLTARFTASKLKPYRPGTASC